MGVRRFALLLTLGAAIASAASPQIAASGVVNAASFRSRLVRGSLASIIGTNLADTTVSASIVPLPTSLGGVTVTVGGVPAPILYVSKTQVNFQVPWEVPVGGSANVIITNSSGVNSSQTVTLADSDLGIFTYARTATANDPVIVHGLTNQLVTPRDPATPGEVIVAYATGVGRVTQVVRTGDMAPVAPIASAQSIPAVIVNNLSAQVMFAGLTPGLVGVTQLNIKLPSTLPSGSLPLQIIGPSGTSPSVNLSVVGNSGPRLVVSTDSIDFGTVLVGQSSTQTFTKIGRAHV